jgi:hypothetical protein
MMASFTRECAGQNGMFQWFLSLSIVATAFNRKMAKSVLIAMLRFLRCVQVARVIG